MKTIYCIGDSNTFGHDPRSRMGERYGEGVRWTGRLALAGYQVIDTGRNGLTIPDERELPALCRRIREAGPVDAVTVMLGTNNLLKGAVAEEAAGRMEKLLRALAESSRGEKLVLIAPPPMVLGEWVQTQSLIRESRRMTEEFRSAARRTGAVFADAGQWGVELTFDGVHFTAQGHAAFAAGLLELLAEILPEDHL